MKAPNISIFSAVKRFKNRLLLCNSQYQKNPITSTPEYQPIILNSIDNVPAKNWDRLAREANIYFNRDFLMAMEKNNSESIEFKYLVLFRNRTPIALACIQIMDFSMGAIVHDWEAQTYIIRSVGNKKIPIKGGKPLRIMICGNAFISGEHGLYIKEEFQKEQTIREIFEAIHQLSHSEHIQKPVNAIIVKDFPNQSLIGMSRLKHIGYHEFKVEPNMVLYLHPSWKCFDDYLSFMKTKFRTKAKSVQKRSNALETKDLTWQEIKNYHAQLTDLYRAVQGKAEFNLSVLNLISYADLKQQFESDFILRSYWLNNQMVGFLSGLIDQNSLDAHFVGLDYKYNRQHAIYQRMLYDYVSIGIERKLKKINMGRTASEIKSTIGASPQELTCYAKHQNPVSNRLVKPLFNYLRPTVWAQRMPFKEAMIKTSSKKN